MLTHVCKVLRVASTEARAINGTVYCNDGCFQSSDAVQLELEAQTSFVLPSIWYSIWYLVENHWYHATNVVFPIPCPCCIIQCLYFSSLLPWSCRAAQTVFSIGTHLQSLFTYVNPTMSICFSITIFVKKQILCLLDSVAEFLYCFCLSSSELSHLRRCPVDGSDQFRGQSAL